LRCHLQSITEPPTGVPAIVLERFREALTEELKVRPLAIAAVVPEVVPTPQPMSARQRIDEAWIGRMLGGTREERRTDPEGLSQAPAP
jgi:hypothetical protein